MITLIPCILAIENEDDRTFIAVLYETYAIDMKRYARSIVGERFAEDALHNAFQNLILHIDQLKSTTIEKRRFFLFTAVRWCALDIKRKEDPSKSLDVDEYAQILPDDEENVVDLILSEDGYESLKTCIRNLSDTYREVLEMKFLFHMKEREIAQALGISEKNVSVRIFRGKKKLQKMIREGKDHG